MGGLSVIIAFLLLGALWFAAVLNEHDIHPMRRLAEQMRRCSVLEAALVASMVAGPIYRAGSKTNGVNGVGGGLGGGANVANVEMLPMANANIQLVPGTELGNGNIGTGNNYTMAALITNTDWLAFGGYEDWFYLDGGGWCFRFGSNLVERLTVFSCGEISPAPFDASNRISLLGLPLSIVPAARWHLIAGNEEQGTGNYQLPTTNYQLKSLFCHSETPSNTLLLTWQNALVNRDTNLPVTVQAELFPDGAAALRYGFDGIGDINSLSNAEARIVRDGVPEAVPLMTGAVTLVEFAAPAIAGTNALDEVCARIAGGNTNAYYCADVVVSKGPAKIRVEPMEDETNRGLLGAYEIVAMPGETNRLPLLIGPKYTVSAEVAFGSFELVPPPFVPLADDTGIVERLEFGDAFSATNITDRLVEIQWPVEFALEEIDATPEATTYALRVTPDWLDGEVAWYGIADTNAPPMRGAPPMRSGGDSCSCGCLVRDGLDLIHYLSCECEHCYANGELVYEGRSEEFGYDMKDPSNNGGNSPGGSGNQPDPDLPSVSVSFDKNVVIFEDRYEDSPGVFVERRSTRTKLTLTAYGGENGGTLSLPQIGGLVECLGNSPVPTSVPAHATVTWEGNFEGDEASQEINDIEVRATFTDSQTNVQILSQPACATVVEVVLHPKKELGYRPHRHTVGVCEVVDCWHYPPALPLVWQTTGENGGSIIERNGTKVFVSPIVNNPSTITASYGGVSFSPVLSIVEPVELICSNVVKVITNSVPPGCAGGVGMKLYLYVSPSTVSFENIAVEEVPCAEGSHNGYFTNSTFSAFWSHTYENGAGRWRNIGAGNYYGPDRSTTGYWPPQWDSGVMSWNVPIGWGYTDTADGVPPEKNFPIQYYSVWTMSPDGTITKSKHGHIISKSTNGVIRLDGVMVNGNNEVFDDEE